MNLPDSLARFQLSGREVPNQLAEKMLPLLVQLGSGLLAQVPQPAAPAATGRTLHLIFKIYRATIQTEMTPHHQAQQSIVPWGTLFLQVVNRSLSPADVPEDTEEREKCSWWKAKKWAYFCVSQSYQILLLGLTCSLRIAQSALLKIRLAKSAR